MKNKNFLQSAKCAIRGLEIGFCTERNFKIYCGIALLFLILNILTGSGLYDYFFLFALFFPSNISILHWNVCVTVFPWKKIRI